MVERRSYWFAFSIALVLHLSTLVCMISRPMSEPHEITVLDADKLSKPTEKDSDPKPIQAVNVDQKEITMAVRQLRAERQRKESLELQRQKSLADQARIARNRRISEQKRVAKLKEEARKLESLRNKRIATEKARIRALAKQKEQEEQRLLAMTRQQKLEAAKLAELRKKHADELARTEEVRKRKATLEKAALNAKKQARIAGEVDKYKALIILAISQQWILPDSADRQRSSEFQIRLAPDGAVLEVKLTRSSGDTVLDRSAQSAIYKASPLPVPSDSEVFNIFRNIRLTVRPESVRG